MSEPWEDIARRLVEHPRFRWREGMLVLPSSADGDRILHVGTTYLGLITRGSDHTHARPRGLGHPELTDWATAGILFGMLDAPEKSLHLEVGEWWCTTSLAEDECYRYHHAVPGAAVALALLAAWGET